MKQPTLISILLCLSCVALVGSVDRHVSNKYPFGNISLSWEERVDDLVSRLTLDEITQQMAQGGRSTHAPAISRLGIPAYPWGSECLRGDVQAGPATSFPQALGLAAAFSPTVVFKIAEATGIEVRAKFNNYSRAGDYSVHKSASCWSPVINIMRDPRWGRNQECYGEDPYLTGQLAAAYVKGLQGQDPRYIRANAGCKHYAVYAGPEATRLSFDAEPTEQDLRMTFLPQFRACVEAGTLSLMCSYNSVDGIPACANKRLLTDILRGEWGFSGYVISDEDALEFMIAPHNYTHTPVDAAALAVKAGTNLEDGPASEQVFSYISKAVEQGKLDEATVREAVKPLFYTRMRLGLFDPEQLNPYAQLNPDKYVQSAEHRELAVQVSMATFVLLKNKDKFLPFSKGQLFKKMAILGPFADSLGNIFGDYAPDPDPKYVVTPRVGLKNVSTTQTYAPGCLNLDPRCDKYDGDSVQKAVTGADLVVVCLGTGTQVEGEGTDRENLTLPGMQPQLLQDAVKYANGTPVILLLFNGGPVDVNWAESSSQVTVILECFFPAQAAGDALYRMFYNVEPSANPAGRLPATWPKSLDQVPDISNYSMEGRTYRYFKGTPLYPFGYGLSFSSFEYRSLSVHPTNVTHGERVLVDVYVQNNGPYDGDEVVQVYVEWTNTTVAGIPQRQMVGVERVALKAGLGRSVQIKIEQRQLEVWDPVADTFVVLKGEMKLYAGGQQPKQTVTVPSNVLSASFWLQ